MNVAGRSRQRGIALVLVLWILVLLGVLAGSQILSARTGLQFARVEYDAAQARALAEAGVAAGIYVLLTGEGSRGFELALGTGQVSVKLEDEAGKLDVNSGRSEQLQRLLLNFVDAPSAERLVAAIQDFKDSDEMVTEGGAELMDYQAAGRDYGPKNRRLDSVSELQQVLGMTPQLYRSIAPFLTVHSRRRELNPELAGPVLLGLLDADAAASREPSDDETPLVRPQLDLDAGNAGFGSIAPLADPQPTAGIAADDEGDQNEDRGRRGSAGIYTVRASGQVSGVSAVVSAVVQIVGGSARRYRMLRWNDAVWGDVSGPTVSSGQAL